jgi:hypothetical protein
MTPGTTAIIEALSAVVAAAIIRPAFRVSTWAMQGVASGEPVSKLTNLQIALASFSKKDSKASRIIPGKFSFFFQASFSLRANFNNLSAKSLALIWLGCSE